MTFMPGSADIDGDNATETSPGAQSSTSDSLEELDRSKGTRRGDVKNGRASKRAAISSDTARAQSNLKESGSEEQAEGEQELDGGDGDSLRRQPTRAKQFWKFRMRPPDDDEPEDWWFASTAIPLLAATIGPMANVLSIAALVTSWRGRWAVDDTARLQDTILGFRDPTWCLVLNGLSLACGFIGNGFLLANFTRRIRYIVALPFTIIFWYFATAILIAITLCMHIYVPPLSPNEIYSQGFWYAVIAAVLYFILSMLLMVNMLGYFLGHYTQHFDLTDEQRNLILQTMMFFIWLAGGAGVFGSVCGWSYVNALYFCDVTILTVGFGDFTPPNDAGRGLVFPYSVGGIIILGLMVSSIQKFARELGRDRVVKKQVETRRQRTMERARTSSFEADREANIDNSCARVRMDQGQKLSISRPFNPERRTIAFNHEDIDKIDDADPKAIKRSGTTNFLARIGTGRQLRRIASKKSRLLILREEKDRFDAMRNIQYSTRRFKQYFALTMSVIAFGILWCVGAVVFWRAEADTQGLSYFQALYFCYVSLLTIGYGDLSPRSNAGKPFFVVWSLIAVPTMTILISDMGDTIIASYKRGTFVLADWTILTRVGFFGEFRDRHPKIFGMAERWKASHAEKKRTEQGFPTGPEDSRGDSDLVDPNTPTLEELAEPKLDEHELARRLTSAIRRTAGHLKNRSHRKYSYEEWAEYTRLIRFSSNQGDDGVGGAEEEEKGIVNWDWIGSNSPMMADQSEAEWVLDRLCESMERYVKKYCAPDGKDKKKEGGIAEESVNEKENERGGDEGKSTGLDISR